jgi:hypothetical protein
VAIPVNRTSGDIISASDINAIAASNNDAAAMIASLISRLDALELNGPSQTTVVTAVPGAGTITANWTAAVGATGYTVTADPITSGGATVAAASKTSSQLTHTFTGLTNGIGYRVTVGIAPSGVQRSIVATPTAGAAAVTVTAAPTSTPGSVLVSWTGSTDATGYLVGRNGTDVNGTGAWSTTDPATARSRQFDNLTPGTSYTFSVTPQPGGTTVTATATAPAGTVVVPDAPPAGIGTVWLSGAGDDQAANVAGGAFGSWRGEAATFGRAWADASIPVMEGLAMMDAYRASNWNGILDVACGGPRDGQTWATAATGGMDATWRKQCQKIQANWWSNCKGIHLSMAHELSGTWYPWSVNSGNLANFKTSWRRWYGIVGEELKSKGRNVKVTLCYNYDTASDVSVQQIDPGTAYYDVLGVDFYNMWWGGTAASGLNTQALWDSNLNAMDGASPKGIGSWFTYATTVGKPLSIPEWGTSPQAFVEAPLFVTNMRNYLASKAPADAYNPSAGKIAGDAYFNTWDQCRLYPNTSLPNTAAAYRGLKWGSTV